MSRHHRLPPPRVHWLPLAGLFLIIAFGLGVDALVLRGIGASAESAGRPAGAPPPPEVTTGGPVIDIRGSAPHSSRVPDRTIALTFDDGPDPTWTPALLEVLAKHNVRATFFVTGANAALHPGLVRRLIAEGHEIGNHGTTHVDVGTAPPWRATWEMRQTQLVLAGAANQQTVLFRPPNSSTPDTLDAAGWIASQRAAGLGHLIVMADRDTKDWQRPGVEAIVAAASPQDQHGVLVLMHDGGGDRSQTVAAVDRLISERKADGWRFATVAQAMQIADASSPAQLPQRLMGLSSVAAAQLARALAVGIPVLLVIASVLAVVRALIVLTTAAIHRRRSPAIPVSRHAASPAAKHAMGRARQWSGPLPAVTVVVPAYNEEAGIGAAVRSILASTHQDLRVIVVDDGSTDGTADVVRRITDQRLTLVTQVNAGKAAALNTGIAATRTQFVVLVDGDTVVEPGTIPALLAPFADRSVGAVAGNAKVGNRRGLLGQWQHIEYVMGFNLDRRMYDVAGCMPTVPGAVGAFRRRAIAEVGGVPGDTLAEDTDLTMALLRANWRVVYAESARGWTEAPGSLGQLWKQRYRWCYGTLQAMYKHRGAVLQRGGGGRLGRRGLPYLLLFQVMLPVLAPVVDIAGLYMLMLSPAAGALTWLAFLLLQLIPAIVAFRLDRERLSALLWLPLQQLVYRQLIYLVVVQSVATALAGGRMRWQKLARIGHATPADPGGMVPRRRPTRKPAPSRR